MSEEVEGVEVLSVSQEFLDKIPKPPSYKKDITNKEELQEKLRKEFKEKDKEHVHVDDTEQLQKIDDGQLRFALKDILFKLDYAEKKLTKDTTDKPPAAEEVIKAAADLVDNLKKSKDLLIEEFKRRGKKYNDIKVEPEKKCAFYTTCRNKIRGVNKERDLQMMLPCYSCEFNTVDHRLPDPRNEFIVIRKGDIPRHHKELKIPMPLKDWESTLVATTVGLEEQFLVLALKDELAQVCALKFLEARRNQYLARLQQQYQEAQESGRISPTPTRGQQAINAAVQDVVRKQRSADVGPELEVKEGEEVVEGSDSGDQGDRGRETAEGDDTVRDAGELNPEPSDVEEGKEENTTPSEEGTTEQKEE